MSTAYLFGFMESARAGQLFEFSESNGVRQLEIYDGSNSRPHTKIFNSKDSSEILLDYDSDSLPDTSILQADGIEITRSSGIRGIFRKLVIKKFLPTAVHEYEYSLDNLSGDYRLRRAIKRPYRVEYKSELSTSADQLGIGCTSPSEKAILDARNTGEKLSHEAGKSHLEKSKQVDSSCPTSRVLEALTIVKNSNSEFSKKYLGCLNRFSKLKKIAQTIQARIEARVSSFDAKSSIVCSDDLPNGKYAVFKENHPITLRTSFVLTSNPDAIAEAIFHEQAHEAEVPEKKLKDIEKCCRQKKFDSCQAADEDDPPKDSDPAKQSEAVDKPTYGGTGPARKLTPIREIYEDALSNGVNESELDSLDQLIMGTLEDRAKNLGCLTRRHPTRDCRKAFDVVLDNVFDRIRSFCSSHPDYKTCNKQLAEEQDSRRKILGNCTSNSSKKYRECPYATRRPHVTDGSLHDMVFDQIALIPDEVHDTIGEAKSPSSDSGNGSRTPGNLDNKETREAWIDDSRAGLGSAIRHVANRAGREILPRAYADDSIRRSVNAERRAESTRQAFVEDNSPEARAGAGNSFARQAPKNLSSVAATDSTESIQQDRARTRSSSGSSRGRGSTGSSGAGASTYTSLQKRNSSGSRNQPSGSSNSVGSATPIMPGDAVPSVAMVDSSLGGSNQGSDSGQLSVAGVAAPAHSVRHQPQASNAAQSAPISSNRSSGQSSPPGRASQTEYAVSAGSSGGGGADSGRSVASFENSDMDSSSAPARKSSPNIRKTVPKELKSALSKVGLKDIANASETQIMKILRSAEDPSAILAYEPVEERLNRLDLRIQAPDGTIYGRSGRKIRRLEDILKSKQ